jgi:hypothetical protein
LLSAIACTGGQHAAKQPERDSSGYNNPSYRLPGHSSIRLSQWASAAAGRQLACSKYPQHQGLLSQYLPAVVITTSCCKSRSTVLIATAHAAVFASAGLITHPAKFLLFTSLITQAISIYCRSLTDKMLKQ